MEEDGGGQREKGIGVGGGVSWEKCQHGISDRAGLPVTGAAWDGEGRGGGFGEES